jgi:hypothetical protein
VSSLGDGTALELLRARRRDRETPLDPGWAVYSSAGTSVSLGLSDDLPNKLSQLTKPAHPRVPQSDRRMQRLRGGAAEVIRQESSPRRQQPLAIGGGPGYDTHVIFYVGVTNVAEALASAEALGATTVLPPQRTRAGKSLSLTSAILLGTW